MHLLFLSLLVLLETPASHAALTLTESFQMVKARSETLSAEGESIREAEERYSQAKGAILPTVNFMGSYLKQEAASQSQVFPTEQRTLKINAVQPLFRGLREYAALRQQSILSDAARLNRAQAETQLFLDTVQAYYRVLMTSQDLSDLRAEIEVNQKRLAEIETLRRIGRSRESEELAIESNIAALEAELETLTAQAQNAKGAFQFLTGLQGELHLEDEEALPEAIEPLTRFLEDLKNRPDLRSLQESIRASDEGVSIARGGHLPSLDLMGNYYFQRPGVLSNVSWDFSLNLTFPIFQGGIVSSGVSIAASERKKAELAYSRLERLAKEQVESSYETARTDLMGLQKLRRSVDLSSRTYQAELKDYRLGLVNHLEVLQALTQAQESKRKLDQSVFQCKVDLLSLQALSHRDQRVKSGSGDQP